MIYYATVCFRDSNPVAVLLPGFAINWEQNQVTRQPQFRDLAHIYYIYVCFLLLFFSFFFHYKRQKENIMIMPKQISISDKSIWFDGCPTAKLGKK